MPGPSVEEFTLRRCPARQERRRDGARGHLPPGQRHRRADEPRHVGGVEVTTAPQADSLWTDMRHSACDCQAREATPGLAHRGMTVRFAVGEYPET
jgi:hypothetical protein